MRTLKPACTEPGQWDRAPDAEAPASEILAYLRHCDACAYHARLTQEEDLALDRLLQDACCGLPMDDVVQAHISRRSVRFPRIQRMRRGPAAGPLQDRARFERRLTQACVAAFGIVVLWISFTSHRLGSNASDGAVAVADTLARPAVPFSGGILAAMDKGRLYVSHIASEEPAEQAWPGTASDTEKRTVAIPDYPFGSILRITNPLNGVSVVVKVVRRSYAEREIFLSPNAATSLDLTGDAIVFVEVLSEPRPMNLAP